MKITNINNQKTNKYQCQIQKTIEIFKIVWNV